MKNNTYDKKGNLKKKHTPVIDYDAAADLYGNESMVNKVLELFYVRIDTASKGICSAYKKKDWQALNKLTHQLSGSSSYACAKGIHIASQELEQCLNTDRKKVQECYCHLSNEIKKFIQLYEDKKIADSHR